MAFPTGYSLYQNVTIDKDKIGATETDFPVLLTEANFVRVGADIFDTVRSDGGDIRVTLSDGTTQLTREVVSIDTGVKTLELWVKIPSLSSSVDTIIRVWYNGTDTEPAEDSTYGKENTWKSSYKMIQHMNQDPSGSSPQAIDSTSNDNDGTSQGSMVSGDLVSAKISNGWDFDGSAKWCDLPDSVELDFDMQDEAFSISGWFSADGYGTIVSKAADSSRQIQLFLYNIAPLGYFAVNLGGTLTVFDTGSLVSAEQKKFKLTVPASTTGALLYIDGVSQSISIGSGAIGPAQNNGQSFNLGARTDGSFLFNGIDDEIRISTGVDTSALELTEYNNQSSPSTFYSVSDEQTGVFPGTSITGTTGLMNIGGYSSAISAATAIISETGSTIINGDAVTVSVGKGIFPNTGSVVLNGLPADIVAGSDVDISTGSVLIGRVNPAISAGRIITSSTGNIDASGINPTIDLSTIINVGTGNVPISGFPIDVSAGRFLTVTTGTLSVLGYQATVSAGNIIPVNTGSVEIISYPSAVQTGATINLSTGSAIINGYSATVINGQTSIDVTTGSLIIVGQNTNVTIIPPTPSRRILTISLEDRVYAVDVEGRIQEIDLENRIFTI